MLDGTHSHTTTTKTATTFLNTNWPPCNPDPSPIGYFVWFAWRRKVYHGQKIHGLRGQFQLTWEDFPQVQIKKTIPKFRKFPKIPKIRK